MVCAKLFHIIIALHQVLSFMTPVPVGLTQHIILKIFSFPPLEEDKPLALYPDTFQHAYLTIFTIGLIYFAHPYNAFLFGYSWLSKHRSWYRRFFAFQRRTRYCKTCQMHLLCSLRPHKYTPDSTLLHENTTTGRPPTSILTLIPMFLLDLF